MGFDIPKDYRGGEMTKEQLDKTIEKIQEILGLETDPNGQPNMLLIRDEEDQILQGIDFTEEVIELAQFIDDNFSYNGRKQNGSRY